MSATYLQIKSTINCKGIFDEISILSWVDIIFFWFYTSHVIVALVTGYQIYDETILILRNIKYFIEKELHKTIIYIR